jgi:hypothetical protein
MEKSESITELTKALIKVQESLKPAVRDKNNPFLKTKYADLSGVWDVCRNLLQQNKLAVAQVGGIDVGGSYLETILAHESGEWISGKYPLKPVKADDPQALGSALTYARRYTLAAILGIVTEDDDAEGAMGRKAEIRQKPAVKPAQPASPVGAVKKPVTAEQLKKLEIFQKAGKNIKNLVDAHKWKVAKLSNLSFEQAETLIKELTSRTNIVESSPPDSSSGFALLQNDKPLRNVNKELGSEVSR